MTARTCLKPIRRTIAAVLYAAIAAGLIWLAITRWNGVPADPSGAGLAGSPPPVPIDPKWDRTEELVAALSTLPPLPKLVPPPAPPGMRWGLFSSAGGAIEPGDILCGEWTPETRPNLQGVVAYLNTPSVQEAMEGLAAIRPGGCRRGAVRPSDIGKAATMFVGRARFRHATLGNIDGALADLETVYRLASIGFHSADLLHILTAFACERLADRELRQMAHEHTFTRAQAARVLEITRTATPDKREMWRLVTASQCDVLDRRLDLAYTDDGHGNGWLVLSHMDDMVRPTWSTERRNGAWNLLSPLFNDRRTVAAKLSRFREAYEKVGELPYRQAKAAAEAVDARALFFGILDGPVGQGTTGSFASYYHEYTVHRMAGHSANIAAAALSAYRHDHREYPPSLEVLLGDYMDALPLDPYVDEPLRYILQQAGDDYLLYAVGPNQVDDGGKQPSKRAGIKPSERDGDKIFESSRGEASWEPKLEVVKQ